MSQMLDDHGLPALKVGKPVRVLVKLAVHAVQRRLKAFQMLQHEIFNIVANPPSLRRFSYFRHNLLRGIAQVVRRDDRQARVGEDVLALLHVGAFEPHDQRHR